MPLHYETAGTGPAVVLLHSTATDSRPPATAPRNVTSRSIRAALR